jgi:hypothetical protein
VEKLDRPANLPRPPHTEHRHPPPIVTDQRFHGSRLRLIADSRYVIAFTATAAGAVRAWTSKPPRPRPLISAADWVATIFAFASGSRSASITDGR